MNIDMDDPNVSGHCKLKEFMCTFDLSIRLSQKLTSGHESLLDLILSNKLAFL